MAKEDRIEFDLTSLPQKIDLSINGEDFSLRLYFVDRTDAYYVDCYDDVGVLLVAGEKLVYGEQLFAMVTDPRLPTVPMIPLDETGKDHVCNFATFQKSVWLTLPTDDATDADDAALEAQNLFAVDDDDVDDTPDALDGETGEPSSTYGTDETVDDILQ